MTEGKVAKGKTEALESLILGYGGRCRDCADNAGVCEWSGLPCDVTAAKRAIRHVLAAATYFQAHPHHVADRAALLNRPPA